MTADDAVFMNDETGKGRFTAPIAEGDFTSGPHDVIEFSRIELFIKHRAIMNGDCNPDSASSHCESPRTSVNRGNPATAD